MADLLSATKAPVVELLRVRVVGELLIMLFLFVLLFVVDLLNPDRLFSFSSLCLLKRRYVPITEHWLDLITVTYVCASLLARITSRSRITWINLMKLRIKLTGAVQNFGEEGGETDVVLFRTFYSIYKTTRLFREKYNWTYPSLSSTSLRCSTCFFQEIDGPYVKSSK